MVAALGGGMGISPPTSMLPSRQQSQQTSVSEGAGSRTGSLRDDYRSSFFDLNLKWEWTNCNMLYVIKDVAKEGRV